MTRHYRHGSTTLATLKTQKETEEQLQNNQYRAIYGFFEQNYQVELEDVPIFQQNMKCPKNITITRYKISDIANLLAKCGTTEHLVAKIEADLLDCSSDDYFGRESFITRLRKRTNLFNKVAEYCTDN